MSKFSIMPKNMPIKLAPILIINSTNGMSRRMLKVLPKALFIATEQLDRWATKELMLEYCMKSGMSLLIDETSISGSWVARYSHCGFKILKGDKNSLLEMMV